MKEFVMKNRFVIFCLAVTVCAWTAYHIFAQQPKSPPAPKPVPAVVAPPKAETKLTAEQRVALIVGLLVNGKNEPASEKQIAETVEAIVYGVEGAETASAEDKANYALGALNNLLLQRISSVAGAKKAKEFQSEKGD